MFLRPVINFTRPQVRSYCSVQKLFIEKIREYGQKKASAGGKLVDATPETEKQVQAEMERIAKHFGGGAGIDMTQFPSFDFKDPHLDPVDPAQQIAAEEAKKEEKPKDGEKKKE